MVGVRGVGLLSADAAGWIDLFGSGFSGFYDHEYHPVYRGGGPGGPVSKIKRSSWFSAGQFRGHSLPAGRQVHGDSPG